ncbi:MAG: helix-turn-helix domain-containing protein, partial [Acidimicrobiaceae bacterium]|nr:helix-turn-helix domain-containing protein [Acidimicrobiaceae bacterium]
MAGEESTTEPMEVSSMAQRLCFGERSRIEAMREAQLSVDEIAERLGRHRSTVYRELDRGGGFDGYCARVAHRRAGDAAARPKMSK